MSNVKRAFLISLAATGVAAVVLLTTRSKAGKPTKLVPSNTSQEIDADTLSEEEIEQLSNELGDML